MNRSSCSNQITVCLVAPWRITTWTTWTTATLPSATCGTHLAASWNNASGTLMWATVDRRQNPISSNCDEFYSFFPHAEHPHRTGQDRPVSPQLRQARSGKYSIILIFYSSPPPPPPPLQPFNIWLEQSQEDLQDIFIVHSVPEIEVSVPTRLRMSCRNATCATLSGKVGGVSGAPGKGHYAAGYLPLTSAILVACREVVGGR